MKKRIGKKIAGLFIVCICVLLNVLLPSLGAFANSAINEQTMHNPFTDVPQGKWYTKAILFCKENGYLAGTSENTFSPNVTVTRAMAVTALWQLAGARTIDSECVFGDVPEDAWYYKAVVWANETGLTSGTSDNSFSPEEAVTREQLVLMIMKYAEKVDHWDVSIRADIETYNDAQKVAEWAKNAFSWAIASGLVSGTGNGTLSPKGTAKRAELAQMLYKFMYGSDHLTYSEGLLEKNELWTLVEATATGAGSPDQDIMYSLSVSVFKEDAQNINSIPPIKVYAKLSGKGTSVSVELEPITQYYYFVQNSRLAKVMEYPRPVDVEVTFVINEEYEVRTYKVYIQDPPYNPFGK